ncbi:MAG TPA: hypothetical protein ENH55_13845 [Aurantimonas coralicida]|uniref:Resolvase/invertase-type recombinase catalytic domain-containing protein n=2 Tax=root TaxID=1 RepID=A0A9C9THQ9_9HYPH|nr:hypothetical protein [Aurantimonas coralicida]HEU00976.1 hypothetical protein [Aurantimonas coralicida]
MLTAAIDMATPAGRMMMQMIGSFAGFERRDPRKRISADLALTHVGGRIGRRQRRLTSKKRFEISESVLSGRKSAAERAQRYVVCQPTVSVLPPNLGRPMFSSQPTAKEGPRRERPA